MTSTSRVALLAEGLPGDLRPLCYGRSTWDVPFLGRPLLVHTASWLQEQGYTHLYLLDDTPQHWLHALTRHLDGFHLDIRKVDARRTEFLPPLPPQTSRVYVIKPFAVYEAHVPQLEEFHEQCAAHATFALIKLDPSSLSWPYIPSCRMDVTGRILDVEKLRRTDTLGSANLENVHKIGFTSRSREFWAPRNLAILEADLVASLPVSELVAPLAGLARSLVDKGVPCYGRALRGRWWSLSTPPQVMVANLEAAALAVEGDLVASPSITTIVAKRSGGRKASSSISSQATVDEEAVVCEGSRIEAGAQVLGRCVISEGSVLEEGTLTVSSVLDRDCRVGADACIEHCLLAVGSVVPAGISFKNAVMGFGEIQNLHRGVPPGGNFLDSLRTVSEEAVRTYWTKYAPLAQRKSTCETLSTLSKGLDNNVYHIFDGERHYVVKRRLDCNALPLLREFHVLRLLEGMNVAPRPYVVDLRPEVEVAPCIIMEFLQGKRIPIGDITPENAFRIGQTCAQVHSFPVDAMMRDLPEISEEAYPDLHSYAVDVVFQYHSYLESRNKRGLGDDPLSKEMRRLLDWANQIAETENVHWLDGVPKVLCQGDLREFNMLVRDDGTGGVSLLDWERCGVDDPAYDLAWFLALSNPSPAAEEALRQGYGDGLPGDDTLWQRVNAYRKVDIVTWPMHLIHIVQTYGDEQGEAGSQGKNIATVYEQDAYDALARALNILGGNDGGPAYSAESVRHLGPLFATINR